MDTPRILGIDFGGRRVGLAVSDAMGISAQGIDTMERRNRRSDFDYLARVLKKHAIAEIVIGLPLRLSGEEGIQAEKVKVFADELRKRFALPVHLWDERMSSAEAHRLLDETEMHHTRRKEVIDQMAAVLILQSFLQARAARAEHSHDGQ
jgi:putative Holliday junction resolvase